MCRFAVSDGDRSVHDMKVTMPTGHGAKAGADGVSAWRRSIALKFGEEAPITATIVAD